MSKKQNIVMGATITAGLAGVLTALLFSKKSSMNWMNGLSSMPIKKDDSRENFLLGGVVGGVAGVLLSLLFAPQSGKDLVKNILRHLQTVKKSAIRTDTTIRPKRAKKKSEAVITSVKSKKITRTIPPKKPSATKKMRVVNIKSEVV